MEEIILISILCTIHVQNCWNTTNIFEKVFGGHHPFCGATDTPFWISGDIHPGFETQGGSLTCMLHDLHVMDSSDSPMV